MADQRHLLIIIAIAIVSIASWPLWDDADFSPWIEGINVAEKALCNIVTDNATASCTVIDDTFTFFSGTGIEITAKDKTVNFTVTAVGGGGATDIHDLTNVTNTGCANGEILEVVAGVFSCSTAVAGSVNNDNIGPGDGTIAIEATSANQQFKRIRAGDGIGITNYTNNILINATGGSVTNENIGSGEASISVEASASTQEFKTLRAGDGITLTNYTNNILINSTGTGTLESLTNVTNTGCRIYENLSVNSTGHWNCDNNKFLSLMVRNPQPSVTNYTMVFNFNSTNPMWEGDDGWRATSGTGTWSNDTSDFISGDQSLRIVTTGDGLTNDFLEGNLPNFDTTNKHCGIWVKADDASIIGNIQVYHGQSTGTSWRPNLDSYSSQFKDDVWTFISWAHNQIPVSGSPTRTAQDHMVFRVSDTGTSALTVHFDSFQCFPEKEASIILRFDDAKPSHWTEARPYLNTYGLKGTFYIIPENLGGGNVHADELFKMQQEGHQIASHGNTDLTTLSEDEIIDEFIKIKEGMFELGFQGYDDFVYPGGNYDNATLNVIPKFFRSSMTAEGGDETSPPGTLFKIRYASVQSSSTCAGIISTIDEAMGANALLTLGFHSINTGASGNEVEPAVFKCIIDHIAVNEYPVKTTEQYMANIRGGI